MKLKSFALVGALVCSTICAQTVEIRDAWVRSSVPGQKATGAFMKISAKEATRLIGVTSPVAAVAEVHEMKMENGVMKMRAVVGGLDIAADKTLELKPGGYHVMLLDLNTALVKGSTVPLTLLFKDGKGVQSKVELRLSVATAAPLPPAAAHLGASH
jgi:copper(I)-binding protein